MNRINLLLTVVIISKKSTSLKLINTLESLVNQTYSPINIIIVDANPPNSEYSLGLQEDIGKYKDVMYYQLDESLTLIDIYNNFIYEIEKGYISFLNLGDSWDNGTALLLINQFKAGDNIGAVFFAPSANSCIESLLTFNVRASSQIIYNINALKSIGGFKEDYYIYFDTDALIRISKEYRIIDVPFELGELNALDNKLQYSFYKLSDYKRLHLKYIDLFIANKKLNKSYYLDIIKLAKVSYLWLDFTLYIMLYAVKYPFWAIRFGINFIFKLFAKTCNVIKYNIKINIGILATYIKNYKIFKNKTIINKNYPIKGLKKIIIGSNIKVIKRAEFINNMELEAIEIPSSVRVIKSHAFNGCSNLKEVIIHDGSMINKISPYAFAYCSSLEKINFPRSISEVCSNAFIGCSSLKDFIFCGRIYKVGDFAFAGCNSLRSAIFSQIDSLIVMGKGAFMHCINLPYFQLSTNMEEIKEKTFLGCKSLKTVKIHKRTGYIHDKAFKNCTSLTKAIILTRDIIISPNAFDKHTKIEKIHQD